MKRLPPILRGPALPCVVGAVCCLAWGLPGLLAGVLLGVPVVLLTNWGS